MFQADLDLARQAVSTRASPRLPRSEARTMACVLDLDLELQARVTAAAPEFQQLGQVPLAAERIANIDHPNTRRAYRDDLVEFLIFIGIAGAPAKPRLVTRTHVLVRRKLAALSSCSGLCNQNSVATNPLQGVKRPSTAVHGVRRPPMNV